MMEDREEVVVPKELERTKDDNYKEAALSSAASQASLDRSWELLRPSAHYALCCLSLFTQSFTDTDARQTFAPVTPEILRELSEAALVQFVPTDPRPYSLPSAIRTYA